MRCSHPPARNIEPRQFCSRCIASHAIARLGDVFGCRGVRRSLCYLTMGTTVARPTPMGASGTVKTALLMTLHRRHPIELCGPVPSTALCRGAALQPPVEDQQVWEEYLNHNNPPAPSRRTDVFREAVYRMEDLRERCLA